MIKTGIKEEPSKIINRFFNGFDLILVIEFSYNLIMIYELVQLCVKVYNNMLNIIPFTT